MELKSINERKTDSNSSTVIMYVISYVVARSGVFTLFR